MLYIIDNKYYIRVAPMIYKEVEFKLINDDVVISTTKNKIEVNAKTIINTINFQSEKDKIKESLCKNNKRNSKRYK